MGKRKGRENLTIRKVEAAKPGTSKSGKPIPKMYGDAAITGLYLRVVPRKSGGYGKYWIQRVKVGNRRRDLGLGRYPIISLHEARDKAIDNRRLIYKGEDPRAEERKAEVPTFEEAARETLQVFGAAWKKERQRKQWWRRMEIHVFPRIGSMRLDTIGREDLLRVLTPIWQDKNATAKYVRNAIADTLSWGMSERFIDRNECGQELSDMLPKAPKRTKHFAAVPYPEVAKKLRQVDEGAAGKAVKLAMRFLVYTAVRQAECRGALWSEIDLDSATWTIPAERTKSGREHRVPLNSGALEVLEEARSLSSPTNIVFPAIRNPRKILHETTLAKALHTVAEGKTLHGFRSSFGNWAAESGVPRDVAEKVLAHAESNSTQAAYYRTDLLEQRRPVMEAWADYLVGESGREFQLVA